MHRYHHWVTRKRGGGCVRVVLADRSIEDRELAARLMAGDQLALRAVYDRYAGLVFGLARKVLGDETLAEDVTQEVFVFVWEQPQRFDPLRGSFRSWLGLLAHHRSVDRVRAEVRPTRGESRVEPAEHVRRRRRGVDDELSGVWVASKVRDAIDQLPPEQRDAVVLAYFGGRTYRQVAIETGHPRGHREVAAAARALEARRALRPSPLSDRTHRHGPEPQRAPRRRLRRARGRTAPTCRPASTIASWPPLPTSHGPRSTPDGVDRRRAHSPRRLHPHRAELSTFSTRSSQARWALLDESTADRPRPRRAPRRRRALHARPARPATGRRGPSP